MKTHISFLGAGNMAGAIVRGLLATNHFSPTDLSCLGSGGTTAPALAAATGIGLAPDIESLLKSADVVVVAFKPQHLAGIGPDIGQLFSGKLVLSVLASKSLATLRTAFPGARNIVRTMPNTPSAIGAGVTGWAAADPLTANDRAITLRLLTAIGKEFEVPENQINSLMGISGCGPAFLFEFTTALREAGVAAGLERELAQTLAIETMLGSARLMARSGEDPEALRNQVTSPGGTTQAGLKVLADAGLRDTMKAVIAAARCRAEELSR